MSGLTLVLACLRALDIEEAVVSLDGSGDSGEATFDQATHRNGEQIFRLPAIVVDIQGRTLELLMCDVAADLPDGDWVNNEGGYGIVTFYPFEDGPDGAFECDMTYRDEYEDCDPDFIDDNEVEQDVDQVAIETPNGSHPEVGFSDGGVL